MRLSRPVRSWAAALFLLSPYAAIADTPAQWEVSRVSSPNSVEELKLMQSTVKGLVERVTPATVGVLMGQGAGSGVIINETGLVLTAAHVVQPPDTAGLLGRPRPRDAAPQETSKRVTIYLQDGTTVKGKVLGTNPRLDSGMVQITDKPPKDAKWPGAKEGKWPFAPLAEAGAVKKGQWVVSLGHPGGPKQDRRPPVRVGQVVKVNTDGKTVVSDCSLVGGDSGGPLFDMSGKVIGIHSRIGVSMEDNFHVSAKTFKDEWDDLVDGYVIRGTARPYMGVVLDRGPDGDDDGAPPVIETVKPGTPAEKAGLEVGDRILKLNDTPMPTATAVDEFIKSVKARDLVKVTVQRGDDVVHLTLKVGKLFETNRNR